MAFRLDPSKDKWLEANKLVRIAPAMPSKTDHDGTEQYQVTLREAWCTGPNHLVQRAWKR
jgi:hypothetical protein